MLKRAVLFGRTILVFFLMFSILAQLSGCNKEQEDDKPFLTDGPWNDYEPKEIEKALEITAKSMADIKAFYYGDYTQESEKMLGATPRFITVDPEASPFFYYKNDETFELWANVEFRIEQHVYRIERPTVGMTLGAQLCIEHEEFGTIWAAGNYMANNLNDIPAFSKMEFTAEDIKECYWILKPGTECWYQLMYNDVCVGEIDYVVCSTDAHGSMYEPEVKVYLETLKSLLIYMAPQ